MCVNRQIDIFYFPVSQSCVTRKNIKQVFKHRVSFLVSDYVIRAGKRICSFQSAFHEHLRTSLAPIAVDLLICKRFEKTNFFVDRI